MRSQEGGVVAGLRFQAGPGAKALERRARPLLSSGQQMKEATDVIARWLEQKRRTDRKWAGVISALTLSSGAAVFLLMTLLIYSLLSIVCGAFVRSVPGLGVVAAGLAAAFFARSLKARQDERELRLDPMGLWIIKDIFSFGPRLILEGLRHIRRFGLLGELDVAACARALAFLAAQNTSVTWEELRRHCPQLLSARLREQLALLDGVLFLGEDASRVSLMDPFRLRLRWMLGWEPKAEKGQPAPPRPEPPPRPAPVHEPEKLNAYELLGLSPSASLMEIKTAYRKRVKQCHPDHFANMGPQAQALAERWTKALNAAYATLNPRRRSA
jgi:DnaJ-domain-containing protein 1